MKNSFGSSVCVTLFGESHGSAVGAVVDGLAPGLPVKNENIERLLARRRPSGLTDTARRESDRFEILSGVFGGRTTGTPLCIVIPNENTRSDDYQYGAARPSHADYAAFCKYHGFEDYRGGGHFSGRVTAALVAVGGILLPALESLGITVGTHILSCGGVNDRDFDDIGADIALLGGKTFPVLDDERGKEMAERILKAREALDSVGGVTQTAVCGVPGGVGEPWFDSVEGLLSHALFSLGGVKGIEFGLGFGFADRRGSEIISDAQSQAADIMRRANAEIELEKQKAADGMRRRIADISVNVAEKLLARSVDGSEHRRLIDSAIDEIGNEDVNNQ